MLVKGKPFKNGNVSEVKLPPVNFDSNPQSNHKKGVGVADPFTN
jgi:hypothetical protein